MSNQFDDRIKQEIQKFLDKVATITKHQALVTVEQNLKAVERIVEQAPVKASPVVGNADAPMRKRRNRRTLQEFDKAQTTVSQLVKEVPGLRSEQIKKALGMTPSQVKTPLRKLVQEGVLRTEGERRSMAYYPENRKQTRSN